MKTVLITFAKSPMADYPLAVVIIDPDNKHWWPLYRSQERLVKSVRDGIILGNGIIAGGSMMENHETGFTWPANVTIDERLQAPEAYKGEKA